MTLYRMNRMEEDPRERMHSQNLALVEAERLDEEARIKREKTRPLKHDKLRGPYGKRK